MPKFFLLEVAFVMMFYPSNSKVIHTPFYTQPEGDLIQYFQCAWILISINYIRLGIVLSTYIIISVFKNVDSGASQTPLFRNSNVQPTHKGTEQKMRLKTCCVVKDFREESNNPCPAQVDEDQRTRLRQGDHVVSTSQSPVKVLEAFRKPGKLKAAVPSDQHC